MYGTFYKMRPLPGKEAEVFEKARQWELELRAQAIGYLFEYVIKPENTAKSGEFIGLVVFDSEENYRKNASNPVQDRWYQQWRALLAEDPEWNDGPIVYAPQAVPVS